jgi:transposase
MILAGKFCDHQPLNRQSDAYAREGIDLDVSTLADWVGACAATLAPLIALIRSHVMAVSRIHGDDTTVPVLAKGQTITGRLWTYVRDDRPFTGPAPPAAVFFYSRDRAGEHPNQHLAGYDGILQADAYAGFNDLYVPTRQPGPVTEAACWAHGRRKFFELAEVGRAPLAVEAGGGSMRSSTSSAASMACPRSNASPYARNASRRWSTRWNPGCARHDERCPGMPMSPKPWITCSSAGTHSVAS